MPERSAACRPLSAQAARRGSSDSGAGVRLEIQLLLFTMSQAHHARVGAFPWAQGVFRGYDRSAECPDRRAREGSTRRVDRASGGAAADPASLATLVAEEAAGQHVVALARRQIFSLHQYRQLPEQLLIRLSGADSGERLVQLLQLLSPMTATSGAHCMRVGANAQKM